MGQEIFISYSRKNQEIVEQLIDNLQSIGHVIWYDKKLDGGKSWWDEIIKNIGECDVFIFALTQESLDSEPCSRELGYARKLKKNVMYIEMADSIDSKKLPPSIAKEQRVAYNKQDSESGMRIANSIGKLESSPPLPDPLPKPPPRPTSNRPSTKAKLTKSEKPETQSELLKEFRLDGDQIDATIHRKYALETDVVIKGAVDKINENRKESSQYKDDNVCYRLITPPIEVDRDRVKLKLNLAPINFYYNVLATEPEGQPYVGSISEKVKQLTRLIPEKLRSTDSLLNANNITPLGTEIVLVTEDDFVLLRRRSKRVLLERKGWDISVSGYSTEIDHRDTQLLLDLTALSEIREELAIREVSPVGKIIWTGLHHNKVSGAIDLLGYWRVPMTEGKLGRDLYPKYPGIGKVFKTKKKVPEKQARTYDNLILPFDGSEIAGVLKKEGFFLIPEALASLIRALQVRGKSIDGLPKPRWV